MKQQPDRPPYPIHPSLDSQLQQAQAHHRAGEFAEAEALYRQILQAVPNHPDALYWLSVIACQSGQYAAALELIDKAILSRPNFAESHYNRGIASTRSANITRR